MVRLAKKELDEPLAELIGGFVQVIQLFEPRGTCSGSPLRIGRNIRAGNQTAGG